MEPSQPNRIKQRLAGCARRLWPLLCRVVPWLLILLPAVMLHRLLKEHMVNLPFLDDWMFVEMDVKAAAGTLTWHDFFVVQMEHRMAFVRGVIMFFHRWLPGSYTGQMWFTWVLLVLTTINIGILIHKTAGVPFRKYWPLLALASVALFSPIQYQILLWAMMFQVATPAFCLSMAMVALLSGIPVWARFLIGVVCALCATLSFATGILIWVLMVPLIWWSTALGKGRTRTVYLVLWMLVFIVTMALYFHNLKNETPPQFSYKQGDEETMQRNISAFISSPGKVVEFVARLLGCHLSRGTSFAIMDASLILGGTSLVLYVLSMLYWWRRFKDETLRRQLLPWLLFASYSVGAATLIALGRVWATSTGDNAITARYVIHAVPLTVALIPLVWCIAHDLCRQRPHRGKMILQVLTGSALALLVIQMTSWTHGVRMMGVWESSRLRGAANALFYKVLHEIEGDIAGNRSFAQQADSLGLLNPPMLAHKRLDNFKLSSQLLNANTAKLNSLSIDVGPDGATAVVQGFACLPDRMRVADAVLLTYKDPLDGHWEIFHVTQVKGLPLYLRQTLARDLQFIHLPGDNLGQEGLASFTARFSLAQVPPGPHSIMAWALNYKRMQVYPMTGYFELDPRKRHVKRLGVDPKNVNLDWFIERGRGNKNWEKLK